MEIRSSSPHPRILARVSKRREKKKKRQRLPCHRSNKFERRSIQPLSISLSFSFSFSLVSSFISAIQLLSPIFATMEAAEIELRIFSLLESPPPPPRFLDRKLEIYVFGGDKSYLVYNRTSSIRYDVSNRRINLCERRR